MVQWACVFDSALRASSTFLISRDLTPIITYLYSAVEFPHGVPNEFLGQLLLCVSWRHLRLDDRAVAQCTSLGAVAWLGAVSRAPFGHESSVGCCWESVEYSDTSISQFVRHLVVACPLTHSKVVMHGRILS